MRSDPDLDACVFEGRILILIQFFIRIGIFLVGQTRIRVNSPRIRNSD